MRARPLTVTASPARSPAPSLPKPIAEHGAGPAVGSFAQVPLLPPTVTIGAPDDPAEREADRAADRATGASAGPASSPIDLARVAPQLQRAVDSDGAAAPGGLIVDDDAGALIAGQMRKSDLLDELREGACAAADRELKRAGRDTKGCPYVDRWLDYYRGRDASHLERAIRKFAPGAAEASAAHDYVAPVSTRFAAGVAAWVTTGQLPADIPPELSDAAMAGPGIMDRVLGSIGGAIGGAVAAVGSLLFSAAPGGGRAGVDRNALSSLLGGGRPLDGAVQSRMGGAFGHSFSRVRVHDDARAAGLSRDLSAHAFTLGDHVAFGAGRYRPGTPFGDALIAHELAHVVQQGGAPPVMESGDRAVEHDANQAAAGVVTDLYAPEEAPRERRKPRLRSGPRLSRCDQGNQQEQANKQPANAPPVNAPPVNAPPAAPLTMDQRSFTATSDDKISFLDPADPTKTVQNIDKQFSVFVPTGALANPNVNKVQIFFTPATGKAGWTPASYLYNEQGLREQIDSSEWITIGVPALEEDDDPNWVTISNPDVAKCLAAAGRPNTTVDTIRLTAHSRGHRGLEHSIGFKSADKPAVAAAAPTIDLSKVDRVSVFDASYKDLGASLAANEKALGRLQDPAHPSQFAPDAIRLYDVTAGESTVGFLPKVKGAPGVQGINLAQQKQVGWWDPATKKSPKIEFAMQSIVYLREFMDASLNRAVVLAPSGTPASDPFDDVKKAALRVLPLMPARGKFSTRSPTPSGMTDLAKFMSDNKDDLLLIGREKNGLKDLLFSLGVGTSAAWWKTLDAHHFIAYELGHEVVE